MFFKRMVRKKMFEDIEDVVVIRDNAYVKTPEALVAVLAKLREIGYNVENSRESEDRKESVGNMEKNGWSLWFAHVDLSFGKCKSCKKYISTNGIACHGHKCELCGAVTYLHIVDGSSVRFSFIENGEGYGKTDVRMKAKRWDKETGYLYLYPRAYAGVWTTDVSARKYLKDNADKFEYVTEKGKRFIRVKYKNSDGYLKDATITMSEVSGHKYNHSTVLVWEGKEYNEYNLPIKQMLHVYETWHWAPLDASPILHKKVLGVVNNSDDKSWFHQDGRPWFKPETFAEMGKFIRNFTTLDADAWDKQSKAFRLDGPGGIDDVAHFCSNGSISRIEERPNVGNLINGFANALSGRRVSPREINSMAIAAQDPEERKIFDETIKHL